MTKTQFEREIKRLTNRLTLLRGALAGDVRLKRVEVKGYRVKSYWMPSHVRFVADRRKRK